VCGISRSRTDMLSKWSKCVGGGYEEAEKASARPSATVGRPALRRTAILPATLPSIMNIRRLALMLFVVLIALLSHPNRALASTTYNQCIYALDKTAANTLYLDGAIIINAPNCGVVVDSSSSTALKFSGSGSFTAAYFDVVGGYTTSGSVKFSPTPTTGSAYQGNPLTFLVPPSSSTCNYTNFKVTTGSSTLNPGTYCNGITISGATNVTFNPGTYILMGGGLNVTGASILKGSGVTFFVTQGLGYSYGPVSISSSVVATLSAPTSGSYYGILFYQDPGIGTGKAANTVTGASASSLEGVLYFPTTALTFVGAVAGGNCLILVADTITLTGAAAIGNGCSGGSPLQPPVAVSVTPTTATLYGGQTQQFTATVTNTSNTAVTWTISPAGTGTINSSGLYTAPATISTQQTVTVTATSQANTSASASATVTLTPKTTPTITWATPAAITYGTALSATQLDATASVAGTFVYTPAAGTVLAAGSQTLSVTFTPTNTTEYNTATATVTLTVNKVTPALTWASPAAITYGTALSATQLDATANVVGTFVYTPAAGTVLAVGSQTLSVTFTPTNTTDYSTATAMVSLTVNGATPIITWATPAAITYGTALSATQLDATASVAGTFVYTPVAGTVLAAGSQILSVTFTPTNTTDYNTATATVALTVNKAAPVITWAAPAAITYGTTLSATQLDATANVAGTFVYTPAAGTVLAAGPQTLSVTFTPTNTTDYSTATATVALTVNQAVPVLTWAAPAAITYGAALSATQLDATASVAGTFVYTPAAGTVLAAGSQILSVTFTPTNTTDYSTATATVALTVNQAVPALTWASPAAITYGTALSATQLDATANVVGTFVYTPAAGTVLAVGSQTLSVTFTPTNTTDYSTATTTVALNVQPVVPPTIVATASPAPNANGWNNSTVTVTFTCTAGSYPIANCPSPVQVTTQTANQSICGKAVDTEGNSSTQACATVSLDETPPTITATVTPTPVGGINYGTATVTFMCSDALSGVATCPSPVTDSTIGTNQVSGTATDKAGNSASASVTVNIQAIVPPSITASTSPAPNSAGWNTSAATVTFTCTAGTYPIQSCPSPVVVSTQGANQSTCGHAVDTQGNASAQVCDTVNLELTPPTITASASPAANSAGWNNTNVTVSFVCTQSASSITSCSSPQTVSQGVGQVITGTVQDQAGNQATASVTLNIDETPPVITQFSAPSQLSPGQSGSATLSVTDLAPIAAVVFALNGSPIGTVVTAPYSTTVTIPSNATSGSTYTLTATVTDVAGNVSSANQGIQIASAGVIVGTVLTDATGLPLQGATLQVLGQSTQNATSDTSGQYSIPVTSSQLFLDISMPGTGGSMPQMVTVERQVAVQSGVGTVPVDARMTALAAPVAITASGGTVGSGAITLTVPAGGATTSYYLTPLTPQGLPNLLPLGWSPVAAFDLQTSAPNSAVLNASFTGLPGGTLYLASYSYSVHAWSLVTPNLSATSGALTVALPSTGDYALAVPDSGVAIPSVGQPLTSVSMVTLPTTTTGTASLSPANVAPSGGTSIASLAVQPNTTVPSGTVIQGQVTETYTLTSGQLLSAKPRYEDLLLYQTPAPPSGSTIGATFPVTPSQTFQPSQLVSGDVHLNILNGRESVRGETGGSDPVSVQSGEATLTIAAGSLAQDTAIAVTPESVDTFLPSTSTLVPVSEYNVNFSDQTLSNAAQLSVGTQGLTPGTNVAIALEDRIAGVPYLVVVSMATVTTTNIVSTPTAGLPGITQGGDYVFYELTIPTGFVSGTVSASSGPVAAMVQTDALPFVAFSGSNGAYDVVAAAGTVNLTASIANTALAGTTTAQVTSGQTATANITVAGQVEAATITPANGAVGISLTPEIDITATAGFNTASVTSSTVVLTAAGSSTPIALNFLFSNGNTKLAIFTQTALQPSMQYTLQANGLANAVGGLISAPTISFTTLSVTATTYNLNALVFAMPDSNGNVAISAPAGSFPAGSTILIVDQTNGVVYSLTVYNDGSVTGSMPATISDVLQVTLTDPSGNVSTLTTSQFVGTNGTTAVGPGGGTVTGPGGTGIIIPAGALNQGTTFTLTLLDQSAFPQLPSWTGSNFGSGIQINAPAMPSFNKEAKLAFPVPANAPAGASYYVYRQLTGSNGSVLFETIDQAFVQGTGASAQVVTASPPFCGYMNSYANFNAVAAASFQPLQAATTFVFMMWDYDPNQAGVASQGLIVGNVYQSSGTGFAPLTPGTSIAISLTNNPAYVTTTTDACGTYSVFDPELGGGERSVTAVDNNTGQVIVDTADEVDGAQPNDSLFSVTAGLEQQYRNIGRLNFTFAPATPPPPPPQINIGIYTLDPLGNRQPINGTVQTGTPLTIAFGSTLSVTSATVNGTQYSVEPDAPPANPTPGYTYTVLTSTFTPTTTGMYTVSATGLNPLNPQSPVTVSSSFLVVGAGGGNTYAVANTPPAVIAAIPSNNSQQVSTQTFPSITFNEPVTNVKGNVTLVGSPAGDAPPLLLIGVHADGSVANPVGPNDAITSLTIEPTSGLEFGETYTLTLNSGIVNVGVDQNGNPIPQLPLPTYTLSFTTFGPAQLGGSSSADEVLTRPVVVGQCAYAGEFVATTLSGLGMFDITNPSSPVDDGVPVTFVGRAIDTAGVAQSPVTGGPLIAVAASTAEDIAIPGNVWLYSVSPTTCNAAATVRAGAVSVTSSADQAGIAVRLAMKDSYLYASTLNQGLQVIDLNQAISDYQQASPSTFGGEVSTDGEGFAMDSIVNTIQLPIPSISANPAPCGSSAICGTATEYGLQADYFTTSGGGSGSAATQTLLVATGMLPLVMADPTISGPSAILYPPAQYTSPLALNKSPLQLTTGGVTYQLSQGRAVALTTFGYTDPTTGLTSNKHIAVVVGSGTVTGQTTPTPPTALLAVADMSAPYTPGSPYTPQIVGFLQLYDQNGNAVAATDVSISGTVAFVATSTNVLMVNLENPSQPVAAGEITGTFGDWITITQSGYLVSTNNVSTNSIQTADLNRFRAGRPGTGHCPCNDPETGVALPINVTNGNVYVDQTDYSVPGLGGGIQISRTWNSLWENSSPVELSGTFGNSWRSTYDERLVYAQPDPSSSTPSIPQSAQYWQGDGTVWNFQLNQSANVFYTVSSPLTEHAFLAPGNLLATSPTSTITFADGTSKIFNSSGYLTAIVDRNGNQTTVNYDAANRISNVTSAGGQVLTFNYGAARTVQSIQDSVGVVATYTYNPNLDLTEVVYADGSSVNMSYDPLDQLLSVKDSQGKVLESHTYDYSRRGLTSVRANGVDSVTVQYTGDGQTQVVSSQNISTSYGSANLGGQPSVTSVTGPGCFSCGGRSNGTFYYDGSGNRISKTDALGRITTHTYDSNSNILSTTMGSGSPSPLTWSYTYNSIGEVLTATDPLGNTTTNTYDPNGNLLTVTQPSPSNGASASVTRFAYNSLGETTTITDALNNPTTITYTSTGLVASTTDVQGDLTTYAYDSRGNRTSIKNALGYTTTFTYDVMNHLTQITYPDSTTARLSYDYRGRRISATDQDGHTTNYTYDDTDRLISLKDAAGNTTTYVYDTENNLTNIIDPNNRTTTFGHDNLGEITQTTFPSGQSETNTYDAAGNLLTKTDRNGQTTGYAYDQLDRLVQKTNPDTTTVNYTYDNDSRVTQVSDPSGTYQYTFDSMGRLTGTSTQYSFLPSRSFNMSFSYDAASNRTGFTDPEGGASAYAYDALNRVKALTPPSAFSAGTFSFTYDALGRRTGLNRPNSVATGYAYDTLSHLLSVLHQLGGTAIDGATYTVDAAGNRTAKTNQLTGSVTNYGYDAIYRLLHATQTGTSAENYTYDPVGNRLSSQSVSQYNYNVGNELTSVPSGNYTYDNNGNTLTDPTGRNFVWDFDNRLTSMTLPGGGAVTFKYDPYGRRIFKSSSFGTTIYSYDGANLVEETDAGGTVVARYIQGPDRIDEPLAMLQGGATSYYDADGSGSITSLTNSLGSVVQTYTYDSFGNQTATSGSIANPFQYAAREFDKETGLYYYRARYYDPTTGRFLSEDPLKFAAEINLYPYAGNNPVNFTDPLGTCKDPTAVKLCHDAYLSALFGNTGAKILKSFSAISSLPEAVTMAMFGIEGNGELGKAWLENAATAIKIAGFSWLRTKSQQLLADGSAMRLLSDSGGPLSSFMGTEGTAMVKAGSLLGKSLTAIEEFAGPVALTALAAATLQDAYAWYYCTHLADFGERK
jgi:RHS repeat-associated protein